MLMLLCLLVFLAGPAAAQTTTDTPVFRYGNAEIWPLIEEAPDLAQQAEPEIERNEKIGGPTSGFFREHFDCGETVARGILEFATCSSFSSFPSEGLIGAASLHGSPFAESIFLLIFYFEI